jgi:DNA-directed RNA polymerase specialized sigma24 family protein
MGDVTDLLDAVPGDDDIERVSDALIELESSNPRLKRLVEIRSFGGFSEVEIAEALGLTERTVRRDRERARMRLSVALRHSAISALRRRLRLAGR